MTGPPPALEFWQDTSNLTTCTRATRKASQGEKPAACCLTDLLYNHSVKFAFPTSPSGLSTATPFHLLVHPCHQYNKYKTYLINSKIPDGTSTTVYRCGPMIDLCVGPHIPNTGQIKAFSVLKNSASYFLGDSANDSLQ
ncbi:threonyl-tRNA synthetase [Puccinia graminis f. sp. tritici]|uniref:Threonyl-tRNA synthetase n=1 Tax=Puccinia graminis f. sp. tritici TaxID=56615 RepID=A0A5B0R2L3_PUCGR|nr:threonyl-tRNA synthetase [Puccinia graminis f. sp. tritici]